MAGIGARAALEPLDATVAIPSHLPTRKLKIYSLLDERQQEGCIGRRRRKRKIPVATVGHAFALSVGEWRSSSERWGEFLTQPLKLRRSPKNAKDRSAIMITSPKGGKFLGYLSKELAAILSPLAGSKTCALAGKAGLIEIQIAEDANVSKSAEKRLERLETALTQRRDGVDPESLPSCPVSMEGIGMS